MESWAAFYEATAAAAATLLGLLFVAVSVHVRAILNAEYANLRRLAEQAFQNYLAVLVLSLLALIPRIATQQFGFSVLWGIGVWSVWGIVRVLRALRTTHEQVSRRATLLRYAASLAGFAILSYAGVDMALGRSGYQPWIASGAILLLITATAVCWQLLIRLADVKPDQM